MAAYQNSIPNTGECAALVQRQFGVLNQDSLTKWPSAILFSQAGYFPFLLLIAIMELSAECLLWEPSVFLLQPPVENAER